jgi:hypothetical protein
MSRVVFRSVPASRIGIGARLLDTTEERHDIAANATPRPGGLGGPSRPPM